MKKKFFAVAMTTVLALSSAMAVSAETATSLTTKSFEANTGKETISGDFDVTYTLHQVGSSFNNSFLVELRDSDDNCIDARSDNWGWTYTTSSGVVDFTKDQKAITYWPSAEDGWAYIKEQRELGVDVVANIRRSGKTFYFEFTESNDDGPIVTWTYTLDFPNMKDETTITLTSDGKIGTAMTDIKFTRNPSVYVQYKEEVDGKYTIRVLAEVTLDGTFSENLNATYRGAGFRCAKTAEKIAEASESYVSTVVFKTIEAAGSTVEAADGKYFVVTQITDVPSDAVLYVNPIYQLADKNTRPFTDKTYTINMKKIIK